MAVGGLLRRTEVTALNTSDANTSGHSKTDKTADPCLPPGSRLATCSVLKVSLWQGSPGSLSRGTSSDCLGHTCCWYPECCAKLATVSLCPCLPASRHPSLPVLPRCLCLSLCYSRIPYALQHIPCIRDFMCFFLCKDFF